MLNKLKKHYVNLRGYSIKRKILVFESDDWGSIRMRSKHSYQELLHAGIPVDKNNFLKYDILEQKEDLERLFDILQKHRDYKGQPAKFTPVSVIANPDFEKIEQHNFERYFYEKLPDTYYKYYGNADTLKIWKDVGLRSEIFMPQFHGREHLNPLKWLYYLNQGDLVEKQAFDHRSLIGSAGRSLEYGSYLAAFDWRTDEEKKFVREMIIDGLKIFNEIFGFSSVSFAPSQGVIHEEDNEVLAKEGVLFHQLGQYFVPVDSVRLQTKNKFWGYKNNYGQIYWRRNARFEPSKLQEKDWLDSCLNEISIAFRWGKPAVISTHRVNYVGGLSSENRNKNLELLDKLLYMVCQKWPEIEFFNSLELAELLSIRILDKDLDDKYKPSF